MRFLVFGMFDIWLPLEFVRRSIGTFPAAVSKITVIYKK